MTKPEVFRDSHWAVQRGQRRGSESLDIFEAAQEAIDDTRKLLGELAQTLGQQKEMPE